MTRLQVVTSSHQINKIKIASQAKCDLIISHQALLMIVFEDMTFTTYCLCHLACLLQKSGITMPFLDIHWLSLLCCRIINKVPIFVVSWSGNCHC